MEANPQDFTETVEMSWERFDERIAQQRRSRTTRMTSGCRCSASGRAGARRFPATARNPPLTLAEQAGRIRSVSYRENFLSGAQRPWATKDGSWTVKSVDALEFNDFSKTLNASSDELRAKPSTVSRSSAKP